MKATGGADMSLYDVVKDTVTSRTLRRSEIMLKAKMMQVRMNLKLKWYQLTLYLHLKL